MARKPMTAEQKAEFAAKTKAAREAKATGKSAKKTKKPAGKKAKKRKATEKKAVEEMGTKKPTYRPRWQQISGGAQKKWRTADGRAATLTVMGEPPERKRRKGK